MPLSDPDRALIDEFRTRFERARTADGRFGTLWRDDRADSTVLASRFSVGEHLWIELTVRPLVPQLRAAIVTDDRWKNEDLEDKIEESGDTMAEFVEMGFEEAGLEWRNPPVEHYRDQGKYFCFATGFELASISQLADAAVVDRITRMFDGYWHAFRVAIEKAATPG